MSRYLARRMFGLVLLLLGIGTVVGVGVAEILHRTTLVPIVVGVAVALGVVYIVRFAREEPEPLPVPEGASPSLAPVTEAPPAALVPPESVMPPTEPYEPDFDPVEEADRLDSEKSRAGSPASEGQDPK